MAKSRIDEVLAALKAAGNDGFGARREVLERLSLDLLHRPALGSQIVARMCAITEPSPREEGLLELLGAGLDAARIARENGKARGQALIDAVEAALRMARGQCRMTWECLKLCVSERAHAVFRYVQASKRPVNIIAS